MPELFDRSRELPKPFLGGYRDRERGLEFHHAGAQTQPRQTTLASDLQERETQTLQLKNARTQADREAATQMTKTGVYVSTAEDRVVRSRVVPTVDDWLNARLQKIILIQCCWRRWLAQQRVARMIGKRQEEEKIEKEVQHALVREKETLLFHEYQRRTHPRTKSDFDLVYRSIENWRLQRLRQIDDCLDGPERKAVLCKLHKDHVALLSAVEQQKITAKKESDVIFQQRLLKKVSAPIKFVGNSSGEPTWMETPWITRARELVALHESLTDKSYDKSERLDLLLSVTITVAEFVCDLTSEISQLVDREVTLLTTGTVMTDRVFDGLRTRIANLFLEFIKNPLFNPQVARFLAAPPGETGVEKAMPNMRFCSSCKNHRPSDQFSAETKRVDGATICWDCERTRNIATTRADMGFYRIMLRELRATENLQTRHPDLSIFLMSEYDLRYLMESIWQNSSVISGRRDMYELKFVRWDKHEVWSPWNCILLTRAEALEHLRMINRKVYSQALTDKIRLRHRAAQNRFTQLLANRTGKLKPEKVRPQKPPKGPPFALGTSYSCPQLTCASQTGVTAAKC